MKTVKIDDKEMITMDHYNFLAEEINKLRREFTSVKRSSEQEEKTVPVISRTTPKKESPLSELLETSVIEPSTTKKTPQRIDWGNLAEEYKRILQGNLIGKDGEKIVKISPFLVMKLGYKPGSPIIKKFKKLIGEQNGNI